MPLVPISFLVSSFKYVADQIMHLGPSFVHGDLQYKLVMAKDAVKANGTFPRTTAYIDECQYAEALDFNLVKGSIVICSFSTGFLDETSSITAIIDTARNLGFAGFAFIANSTLGDFIAEPIPFSVPGIMIPRTNDSEV